MIPLYCRDILTFWPLTLKVWSSSWKICLRHSLENVNGNNLIFYGHMNLVWDLCTMRSFWPFVLCPWYYDLHIDNIFWSIAQLGNYTCYLTSKLWPSPWQICRGHCSGTIWQWHHIFSNLTWHLSTIGSFWHLDFCPWNCDLWFRSVVCKFMLGQAEGYSVSTYVLLKMKDYDTLK